MKKSILILFSALLTGSVMYGTDLHINNQDYAVDTIVVSQRVGPGVSYAQYRLPKRPLDIFVLEMDLTNPYLNLEVWNGGNAAVACETPTHAGKRYAEAGVDVIAVHNGDFFSTTLNETGISRMGLVGAGEMLFNPTGNPLFCLDNEMVPRIDYVNFGGTITTADGKTARLHTVNQLRLEWEPATATNQLSLYTPAFGARTHAVSTGGHIAVIKPITGNNTYPANTALQMEVVSVSVTPGQVDIPTEGAVLHGVGSSSEFLSALKPGDKITVNLGATMPSYPDVTTIHEAIGGSGHIILRNGQVLNINNPDVHPRTFMGISQDKKTVYSVVVDGRSGSSAGIDLDDQGRVLAWLGAWDGINLDGGGSSCMVVNGVIRNHGSDGSERAVGNGVILYSTAPQSDKVTSIQFKNTSWELPIASRFEPIMMAFNEYDYLVADDYETFTLSCDPEVGTVSSDGHSIITSTKAGTGTLTATTPDGVSTSVTVTLMDAEVRPVYDSYIIDNRNEYPLLFSATAGGNTYSIEPSTIGWSVADPTVAEVNNGKVIGKENGTTTLLGEADHFSGTITLTTENAPACGYKPVFDQQQITAKQTGGTALTVTTDNETYGCTITYTGNGTARGSYIQLNGTGNSKMKTYGLPEAIEIRINPGEATINQIRMNYSDHHGNITSLILSDATLEKNKETIIVKQLSEILDVTDNSFFPITFDGLRFEMGTSAKNTDFTIAMPVLRYLYGDIDSVDDIHRDTPATGHKGSARLYRLDGTPVQSTPAPGIYVSGNGEKILVK